MEGATDISEVEWDDVITRAREYPRFTELQSKTEEEWDLEVEEEQARVFEVVAQNGIIYHVCSIPFETEDGDTVAGIRLIFKNQLPFETSASWVQYRGANEAELRYATIDQQGGVDFISEVIEIPLSKATMGRIAPAFSLNKCRACIKVAKVIKSYGCDLSVGVICALAGLPVIPGIVCAILVIPLCAIYKKANQSLSARDLCIRSNFCTP